MEFNTPYGIADDQSASYFCGLQEGLACGAITGGVGNIGLIQSQVTLDGIAIAEIDIEAQELPMYTFKDITEWDTWSEVQEAGESITINDVVYKNQLTHDTLKSLYDNLFENMGFTCYGGGYNWRRDRVGWYTYCYGGRQGTVDTTVYQTLSFQTDEYERVGETWLEVCSLDGIEMGHGSQRGEVKNEGTYYYIRYRELIIPGSNVKLHQINEPSWDNLRGIMEIGQRTYINPARYDLWQYNGKVYNQNLSLSNIIPAIFSNNICSLMTNTVLCDGLPNEKVASLLNTSFIRHHVYELTPLNFIGETLYIFALSNACGLIIS